MRSFSLFHVEMYIYFVRCIYFHQCTTLLLQIRICYSSKDYRVMDGPTDGKTLGIIEDLTILKIPYWKELPLIIEVKAVVDQHMNLFTVLNTCFGSYKHGPILTNEYKNTFLPNFDFSSFCNFFIKVLTDFH